MVVASLATDVNNVLLPNDALPVCTESKMALFTPDLKAEYDRDGFVVLRGFYSPEELDLLRRNADRAMDGREGVRKNLQHGDAFFGSEIMGGGHHGLVSSLVGDDLVPATCGYFDKPIGTSTPIEPHRDGGGFIDGATLWIALDDADTTNGCMHYTAGSHLNIHESLPAFALPPEGRDGGTPIEASAGDAIIHSAKVVHFSEKSTQPRRRRALTYFYWSARTVNELEVNGREVPGGRAPL